MPPPLQRKRECERERERVMEWGADHVVKEGGRAGADGSPNLGTKLFRGQRGALRTTGGGGYRDRMG